MIAFLFVFFCSAQAFSQVVKPTQSIDSVFKFTNAVYNMGKIQFGKPVQYNVTIQNISTDSVAIKNVSVGCGCTTPKYTAGQVIQPGQTATVTLGFNGSAMGLFTKFATIFFSNGLSKQVQFTGEAVKQ